MISIICPTRNRPEMYAAMVDSCLSLAKEPDRIEIITYVDHGDHSLASISVPPNVTCINGPQLATAPRYNRSADFAQGPIIFTMNDDVLFRTQDWDAILRAAIPPDDIYCLYPDDGLRQRCGFAIISKKWIEIVGYYHYPALHHNFGDTWMEDIGSQVGRLAMLPILCEHNHPLCNKREWDDNDREQSGGELSKYKRDEQIYNDGHSDRLDAASRLRDIIRRGCG